MTEKQFGGAKQNLLGEQTGGIVTSKWRQVAGGSGAEGWVPRGGDDLSVL